MLIKSQKYVVVKPSYKIRDASFVSTYIREGDIVTLDGQPGYDGNVGVGNSVHHGLIHQNNLIPYIGPDNTPTQPFTERDLADALKVLCIDTDAAKVYTLAQAIKEAR